MFKKSNFYGVILLKFTKVEVKLGEVIVEWLKLALISRIRLAILSILLMRISDRSLS